MEFSDLLDSPVLNDDGVLLQVGQLGNMPDDHFRFEPVARQKESSANSDGAFSVCP